MEVTRMNVSYTTEQVPSSLKAFERWTFTSGSTTGEDFREFAKLFFKHLNKVLKPKGLRLCACSTSHYYVCGFVTPDNSDKKFVYFSISDVRYFKNTWVNNILIRTAESDHDWTGGPNNNTTLAKFAEAVGQLI